MNVAEKDLSFGSERILKIDLLDFGTFSRNSAVSDLRECGGRKGAKVPTIARTQYWNGEDGTR